MIRDWRSSVSQALIAILAIALVTRVVWELLAPAIPLLLTIVIILGVYRMLLGGGTGKW